VVAPAVGPTLGGWLSDWYGWRWIFFINVPVGILSLILTSIVVPPDPKRKEKAHRAGEKVDYLGFALIALGLGCLQVVLDRGQIDDWFGSERITLFAVISGASLILLVIHELTFPYPAIDLPLLGHRNFFFANLAIFVFGLTLFSTTQMIPQMVQESLGYTATWAGLALSPGAGLVLMLLPMVGWMLGRTQPKYLIAFGFFASWAALSFMAHAFTLQSSFFLIALARCFQAVGLGFLFVPINTIAYMGLPKGSSNNASALLNLMRNLGGSVGIAAAQTMIDRRSQFHQQRLCEWTTPLNLNFWDALHGWLPRQTNAGPPTASMLPRTLQQLYNDLGSQATLMSYLDVFQAMSFVALAAILISVFLKHIKPGEGGGHGG